MLSPSRNKVRLARPARWLRPTMQDNQSMSEKFSSLRSNGIPLLICSCVSFGRWYNSEIFSSDWFGDAMGREEDSFMVSEGRFGNVSTIYDPDHILVGDRIVPSYNPYGYMTSTSNYQVSDYALDKNVNRCACFRSGVESPVSYIINRESQDGILSTEVFCVSHSVCCALYMYFLSF